MQSTTRIFISYAHEDEALIADDLTFLRSSGFGISVDRSIRPGTDWRSQIADSLTTSDIVLFFSSINSNLSKHCLAEISFALDLEKPVVVVMLQDLPMAPGLRLYLGQIQGIQRFRLPEAEYQQALITAIGDVGSTREASEVWQLVLSADSKSGEHEVAFRVAETAIKLKSLEHPKLRFSDSLEEVDIENVVNIKLAVQFGSNRQVKISVESNSKILDIDEVIDSPDDVYLGTRLAERVAQVLLRATNGEIDIDLGDVLEVDSTNPQAVIAYLEATRDHYGGEISTAVKKFENALQIDPSFGLAARGAAVVGSLLGKDTDVEKYFRLAFSRLSSMTRGEKARTKSAYYLAAGDFQRAIPELRECVSIHPSAHGAKDNLALAHLYARNVKLALSGAQANFAAAPASFLAGANLAMYHMYAGEYDQSLNLIRSLRGGRGAFALNTTVAICQLMLGKVEEAKTVYESMILGVDSLRTAGALGLADLYAYEG